MNKPSLLKLSTALFALALMGCGADTVSAPFPAANSHLSGATLFADGKIVVKAPAAVSPFTKSDGTHVIAASNQLLVSFDAQASDEEIDRALQRIFDLGGVLVGDIPARRPSPPPAFWRAWIARVRR